MQGGISIKYKDIEHEIEGNSAFKLDTKGAYMEDDITISTDIEPELGEKTITENGTYHASEDNLDGYGEVNVNVSASNYNELYNKPQIESVTLEGDKSFADLGLNEITPQDIDDLIFS